jgi:hypothetical protein
MLVSRPCFVGLLAACLAALLHPSGSTAAPNVYAPDELATDSTEPAPEACSCTLQGPDPVSAGASGIVYTLAVSPGSTCITVVEGAGSIEGSTTGSTIVVSAGLEGFFIIRTTVAADGCTTTCSRTVDITANLASTNH